MLMILKKARYGRCKSVPILMIGNDLLLILIEMDDLLKNFLVDCLSDLPFIDRSVYFPISVLGLMNNQEW